MIAYAHTSLRVLGSWFCVIVWRVGVQYSSRCCVVACVCVLVWRVCVGVCGGAALVCAAPLLVVCCGGFLLSRTPWGAVPWARPGLASRFGMLLGVSPVL